MTISYDTQLYGKCEKMTLLYKFYNRILMKTVLSCQITIQVHIHIWNQDLQLFCSLHNHQSYIWYLNKKKHIFFKLCFHVHKSFIYFNNVMRHPHAPTQLKFFLYKKDRNQSNNLYDKVTGSVCVPLCMYKRIWLTTELIWFSFTG